MDGFTPDGANTSPFYTFDAFDGTGIDELLMILNAEPVDFRCFIDAHPEIAQRIAAQGIEDPTDRQAIDWDDANLIFVATHPLEQKHKTHLASGNTRDRMGRIPYGDGDAIGYLMMFIRPPASPEGELMSKRISMLHSGFSASLHGHDRFSHGKWGMQLCGYLIEADVNALQLDLKQLEWSVAGNEPLDGGVRTIVKDLNVILRTAARQRVGVLLRAHS